MTVAIGTYGFRADRAVVRVDPEQHEGRLIRHFMVYLDNALLAAPGAGYGEDQGALQLLRHRIDHAGPVDADDRPEAGGGGGRQPAGAGRRGAVRRATWPAIRAPLLGRYRASKPPPISPQELALREAARGTRSSTADRPRSGGCGGGTTDRSRPAANAIDASDRKKAKPTETGSPSRRPRPRKCPRKCPRKTHRNG